MLLTIRHREGDERHLPNRDREDRLSSRLVLVSLSGAAFEETAAMTPGAARARLPRAGPPTPPHENPAPAPPSRARLPGPRESGMITAHGRKPGGWWPFGTRHGAPTRTAASDVRVRPGVGGVGPLRPLCATDARGAKASGRPGGGTQTWEAGVPFPGPGPALRQ